MRRTGLIAVVLVAGTLTLPAAGSTAATPESTAAASAPAARNGAAAVALADGRILFTGGFDDEFSRLSTADVYDPATDSWASATPMSVPRASPSGVLLPDGRVLVAGGAGATTCFNANPASCDQSTPLKTDGDGRYWSAEIYDPVDDSWTPTGSMVGARAGATLALLGDGRVLAAGGNRDGGFGGVTAAETWDPETGAWAATANQPTFHNAWYASTVLDDGRVLLAGGQDGVGPNTATVDIYDPGTDSWTAAPPLEQAMDNLHAVTAADGRVLLVGGPAHLGTRSLIYDPTVSTWSDGPTLPVRCAYCSVTELADGSILLAGGVDNGGNLIDSTTVIDPALSTATPGPDLLASRYLHTAMRTADNTVFIAFGNVLDSNSIPRLTATTELMTFEPVPPPPPATADLAASIEPQSSEVAPGDQITYRVGVDNLGPDAAAGVTITMTSYDTTLVWGAGCTAAGVQVVCDVGALAAHGSASRDVTVQVDESALGEIFADAFVAGSDVDPEWSNDYDWVSTPVVGDEDTERPTVMITTPEDGASYTVGDNVTADYLCDDGLGSGVATCEGSSSVGEPVFTDELGDHTFTVEAVDNAGNFTTAEVSYTVVAAGDTTPPEIWLTSPFDGRVYSATEDVVAYYSCDDIGVGIDTCVGDVPHLEPFDMSPGAHEFTVTATDLAGNTTSKTVSYFVDGSIVTTDTTKPYVWFKSPGNRQRVPLGSVVTVDYECIDPPPLSTGVAECTGSVPDGSLLDTSQEGAFTMTVMVRDGAGNTRLQWNEYQVIADGDLDQLPDLWETDGIDVDRDGLVDYTLAGADPNHKDLFVEMDYMDCSLTSCDGDVSHRPQPEVAGELVTAFANAPLNNPDGTTGVRLHLLIDEAVPEVQDLSFFRAPGAYDDFEDIKAGSPAPCDGAFGTAAERATNDCLLIMRAKSLVYRYGLFGHSYGGGSSSGIGEYPGNDFLVTTGGYAEAWANAAGTLGAAEAGTVMHELGHTLGLGHGGPKDNMNCKPNYLSVMSYPLQVPSHDPDRPLDYSRAALPTLFEGALVESAGVSGPAGRDTVFNDANGQLRVAPANGPIDWDGDGNPTETVAVDINSVGWSCFTPGGETLLGADDWSNLTWSFYLSPDYAPGSRFTSTELVDSETPVAAVVEASEELDADGDGLANAHDNCGAVANPGQSDLDADGEGDLCDDVTTVAIVVRPESGSTIRLRHANVEVSVLSAAGFDAPRVVDRGSLTFGVAGRTGGNRKCTVRHVNNDGLTDLACLFPVKQSGIRAGTQTGVLRGVTKPGWLITGSAEFTVVP